MRAKNHILAILLLVFGGNLAVQAQLPQDCNFDKVIIAGFDNSRSGDASFSSGSRFSLARAGVLNNFPATSFTGFPTLTKSNLLPVDVLVIGVATTTTSDVPPLSTNEQTALYEFVKNGGTVVLFTDNDTFDAQATNVNASFLSPFGLATRGTVTGGVSAFVPIPAQHPITAGPFGNISSFSEFFPGSITNLGPYATSLATNSGGCVLAVIEAGAIAPQSGRVVIFSDISGFWNTDGYFPANSNLFMNVMNYARQSPQHKRVRIESAGTNVVLRWPLVATNVVLEASSSLGASAVWNPVLPNPVVIGGENFVTNAALAESFYRLRCAGQ
jgi:hypothetical protein